jgi:hypothetical protein
MKAAVDIARKKVLQILNARLGLGQEVFESKILHEIVNTPETCELASLLLFRVAGLTSHKGAINLILIKGAFSVYHIASCTVPSSFSTFH